MIPLAQYDERVEIDPDDCGVIRDKFGEVYAVARVAPRLESYWGTWTLQHCETVEEARAAADQARRDGSVSEEPWGFVRTLDAEEWL